MRDGPALRHPHVVAILLVAVAFAGCVDDDSGADVGPPDPSTSDGGEGGEGPAAPRADDGGSGGGTGSAPTWRVGDYWVFEGAGGGTNTFVVTEVTATDYIMDTDGDSFASFDAIDDVSTLGPQRKSDLAGSQGSERVEFFRFPLTDGDTWTTMWDGEERTIVAAEAGGVFEFTSSAADGTPHARYTFDAAAGWFGVLEFIGEDGRVSFGNTLVDSGTGYDGEVVRYEVEEVFARGSDDGPAPGVDTATSEFEQTEAHTDVYLRYNAGCAAGYLFFSVVPDEPAGDTQGHSANDPCPKNDGFTGSLGSRPGPWGVTLVKGTDPDAHLSATVYLRTQIVLDVVPDAAQ